MTYFNGFRPMYKYFFDYEKESTYIHDETKNNMYLLEKELEIKQNKIDILLQKIDTFAKNMYHVEKELEIKQDKIDILLQKIDTLEKNIIYR